MPTATSANALEFLQQAVTEHFGWPRALYSDNGSHFTGGVFPRKLADMKVRHILAPITHPSSVGLAERYVQIVLSGLRSHLQTEPQSIFRWDRYVSDVVKAANTQTIRTYGYTPSELLLGINARHYPTDDTLEDEIRGEVVANVVGIAGDEMPREEAVYTARLAAIDEIRDRVTSRRLKGQQRLALGTEKSRADLERGDLVLLRRSLQDNQRGHKLEPRWTGPYKLAKISKHGQSGWIEDLHGRQDMGKYHINDLKKFVPRTDFDSNSPGWQSVAVANEELQVFLLSPRRQQEQTERAMDKQEQREI